MWKKSQWKKETSQSVFYLNFLDKPDSVDNSTNVNENPNADFKSGKSFYLIYCNFISAHGLKTTTNMQN